MQLDLQAALERALAGHYQVIREIGRGGMAVVYECRDLIAERSVAIKLLYPDLARALGGERFLREIRILQQLNHPNILSLLDSGAIELLPGVQLPWYAMPLAREETLRARLTREGALPLATALGYARDLCAALTHAHGQGVIHRDIKPENILLVDGHAVLADFGIARAITVAGGETLSTTGIVVGTPAYMSPEQSTGARQLDGRSDLYSLGVVLYEMLAGHAPFSGSTPQAVSARHQFETPPPISVVRPGLPAGVNQLLDRMLSKVAADRPEDAGVALTAVTQAGTTIHSQPKRNIRRRVIAGVVAVGLLATRMAMSSSDTPLDESRYVVLPFQTVGAIGKQVLNGGDCLELVANFLVRIPEHRVVSTLTVSAEVEHYGGQLSQSQALRIAKELGAGRMVWGQVREVADTVLVTGILYDVRNGRELESHVIRLPVYDLAIGTLSQRFAELAYRLVLPGQPTPETANAVLAAKSVEAWRHLATGDSALAAWNLVLAGRKYREALALDPSYPDANLRLAQISEWQDIPSEEWLQFAQNAAAATDRLNGPDQLIGKALLALAEKRYPAACDSYRALIRMDSLSFQGWFGLGQCLTKDDIVIRDSVQPSGYRFRTSYREAISAYRRGLALVPAGYLNYAGGSAQTLSRRLAATPGTIRIGRLEEDSSKAFPAAPGLDHDTLAYLPMEPNAVVRGEVPTGWTEALQRNRDTLLAITTFWINRFPKSSAAQETQADALELAGHLTGPDSSHTALGLTRILRRAAPGSLSLAAREVRLLVKIARYSEARMLAESTLAVPPADKNSGQIQAALAALIGRTDRVADLLGEFGDKQFATPLGDLVEVPANLARDANRLLAYAGEGAPHDSLIAIQHRLSRSAEKSITTSDQARVLDALLFQPSLLGFPDIRRPLQGNYAFAVVAAALIRGDTTKARNELVRISANRPTHLRGLISPDYALLEARLLAMVGDPETARARVREMLEGLPHLGADLLGYSTQTAAIGRALRFNQTLGPGLTLDTALVAIRGPS